MGSRLRSASPRIRADEAAVMLGLPELSLRREAKNIPGAEREGKTWTFNRVALRRWWDERLSEAAARHDMVAAAERAVAEDKLRASLLSPTAIAAAAMPWVRAGCGIYFLLKGEEVVYVGQARVVSARVAQHALSKSFDAWHWVPCVERDLNRMERAYINALMPRLNRDPVTQKLRSSKIVEGANA